MKVLGKVCMGLATAVAVSPRTLPCVGHINYIVCAAVSVIQCGWGCIMEVLQVCSVTVIVEL